MPQGTSKLPSPVRPKAALTTSESTMQRTTIAVAFAMSTSLIAQTASFTSTEIAPTVVQFTDTSTGGTPVTWSWDFNTDGVIDDTAQNPVFVYPGTGVYTCTLSVDFGTSINTVVQSIFIGLIPVPDFGSTFSSGGLTRGLWFQAPTRFSIIAAQVPDESGHGLQNVAIYRLAAAPPLYSASATGGLEFFSTGTASGVDIPCAVSFDTNEFIGVLGACGDGSTMRSSYANVTGGQPATVLGQPTTITRFLTQTNIVATGGTGAYSTEVGGALGRVLLTVSPCVGLAYGNGSPSSVAAAPILRTTDLPFVGQTAKLTIENFDSNVLGILAVGIGRVNVTTPLGDMLINNIAGSVAINGGALMQPGAYDFSFAIPNDPALQGFGPVNWQAACYVSGTNEFALSNGNEWWLAY
ncbi:MAG: PKD repeat protein [Neolewinella sp.]|jgi:PKD repeat protein